MWWTGLDKLVQTLGVGQKKPQFSIPNPAESDFRAWLISHQQNRPVPHKYNPDDTGYNWRAAKTAGAEPIMYEDAYPHWPSEFKTDTHPNRYVNGIDTKTGEKLFPY